MKNYVPTQEDLEWARTLVGILKDTGHWGCSWGIYVLNKNERTLTCVARAPGTNGWIFEENHAKAVAVFREIGYEMTDRSGKEIDHDEPET